MTLSEQLSNKAVITLADLSSCLDLEYSPKKRSREALIAYHLKQGHLLRIRRGLYAAVPPGSDPAVCPVDPYLVAANLADDAVLAYHTALEVQGKAHSVFERYFVQSGKPIRPTTFRTYRFEGVLFPKPLRKKHRENFATIIVERSGLDLRVTSLERTLVDLLDRPHLGGGWEEIWRSLESVGYFDLDLVVEYAKLLGNRTTAAKTGYFLQDHAETFMIEDRHLDPLRKLRPQQPHYIDRSKGGTLNRDWNLVIPRSLAEKSWEEPT